jgi:radical SAM superfamily enzyme YgiQ (UPF0313 family)
MKILLINPPFYRFIGLEQDYVPISLQSVGSKLIEDGHEVYLKNLEIGENTHYLGYTERSSNYDKFIESVDNDEHIIWKELHDTIKNIKPDKIGITVLNVKYKTTLKIIDIVNSYNIPIMIGGSHPTILPNLYPKNVEIYKGEFESLGGRIKNLDNLPLPNFDMLMDSYSPNGYAHMLSSRGCPFDCTFCASKVMWNRRVTYKSVDRVLTEMKYVKDRFNSDYFTFWDETWTMNKKRVLEFSEKYNIDAMWRCDTRADSLDEEMLIAMKKANLGQLSMGIETSDEDILKKINKNETQKDFIKAAELLDKHDIQWKAYMIIGFPEDTEEKILKSIEFIKKLNPFRITLSFFTPYVGTQLYEQTKTMGLIDDNYDMSLFSHQSPYNYFCPLIPKERYSKLKNVVTEDVDNYNKNALKIWT